MKKVVFFFAVILIAFMIPMSVSAAESGAQVKGVLDDAVEYNGNYYLFVKGDYTWEQAKTYCEGLGGHLATVTSQGEDDFCYDLWRASGTSGCWLGATDAELEGVWNWITGESWSYSSWGGGEPNGGTKENVINYNGSYKDGRWNDFSAQNKLPFICEWEKENVANVRKAYGVVSSSSVIYNHAFYYNGHIYNVFNYEMSWEEAKEYCEKLGGHLAIISSHAENRALFSYVASRNAYNSVFGATDKDSEGVWQWVSGEAVTYANWGEGEPNNSGGREHYVHFLSTFDGKWNDCAWQNSFVCEWDNACVVNGTITRHAWGTPRTVRAATCEAKGEVEYVCDRCGVSRTEDIEMLPHVFGDWQIAAEATCHKAGEQFRRCLGCGQEEKQVVEQLAHNYVENGDGDDGIFFPPTHKEQTCTLCGDTQVYKDLKNTYINFIEIALLVGLGIVALVGIGVFIYNRKY